jgi:hypothetical protein
VLTYINAPYVGERDALNEDLLANINFGH